MKGFVLTFKNQKDVRVLSDLRLRAHRAGAFLSRHGLQTVFILLFLFGMIIGAACSQCFDRTTYDRLDLLFVTNINARAQMSLPQIFLSCFVSYFVFGFCAFLCALSAWGVAAVPLVSAWYGFTVGLSSAFVFSLYQTSGIGFYILVVLPGAFLFLLTLLRYAVYCFRLSREYASLSLTGSDDQTQLHVRLKTFLKQSLLTLLSAAFCSIIDMVLWMLFADKFHFW